jgi:hypothetical protein
MSIKTPDVPTWLSILRDESLLNSRDVAQIFGYATADNLVAAITKGAFPSPAKNLMHKQSSCDRNFFTSYSAKKRTANSRRHYWTKAEVIAEINRRKALAAAQ